MTTTLRFSKDACRALGVGVGGGGGGQGSTDEGTHGAGTQASGGCARSVVSWGRSRLLCCPSSDSPVLAEWIIKSGGSSHTSGITGDACSPRRSIRQRQLRTARDRGKRPGGAVASQLLRRALERARVLTTARAHDPTCAQRGHMADGVDVGSVLCVGR